jgi:hypothetical protein
MQKRPDFTKLDNGFERVLLVPDAHIPYQDKKAWALLIQTIIEWKPHRIIIVGDLADCKSVTGHRLKPRERALLLADELHDVRVQLERIRKLAPDANIVIVEGNHEYRIDRYVADNAPALEGMFSFAESVGLNKLGIKYVKYGDYYKLDRMHFTHDLGKAGPNAHRSAREEIGGNIVIGHTHRMGIEYGPKLTGTHVSANFGWLGGSEADVDYNKRLRQKCSTVLGFGVAFRHVASGLWWLTAVPILQGKVCIPTQPLLIK